MIERDNGAPRAAREFTRGTLARWGYPSPDRPELVDDAVLVASELVTNVVMHAGTEGTLRLARSDGHLRIECVDFGPGWIGVREVDRDGLGGRGLRLVAQLAARWGIDRTTDEPPGNLVWAELDH